MNKTVTTRWTLKERKPTGHIQTVEGRRGTYGKATKAELIAALWAIEQQVGGEWGEVLDMEAHFEVPYLPTLSEREREMHERISAVYRLAHAFNVTHSCYGSHEGWRKEIEG